MVSDPTMRSCVHYQETICAGLRGEAVHWSYVNDAETYREFMQFADYHGVGALVYYALKQSESLSLWPAECVDRMRTETIDETAREAIRCREISIVLSELANAGVSPLLLKGTPLAYFLYPEAALRHRSDTDMLIRENDRGALSQVLARLGYVRGNGITGELVSTQSTFSRVDRFGVCHDLDVHWRISNFHVFAAALAFQELAQRAVPVAALGPHARTLRPIDALILACMHRLGHRQAPYYVDGEAHYDSNRLIWLYDIHLLAQSLAVEQWEEFARVAMAKQLQQLCLDGLNAAKRAFGTSIPAFVEDFFIHAPKGEVLNVSRFYLSRWRWELSELGALPTWKLRLKLLQEHLAPSPAYLLEKYELKDRRWLPLFYVGRALAGVWKRL